MRTRNAHYWVCQVAGWGVYSFGAGLSTGVIANGWRRSVVIGYLLLFLYSIGLTHLLRSVIHRRNWTSLSLPSALMRQVPASILIAAVQSTLVVCVYTAIEGNLGEWSQASSIAYMFIGLSVVDTIWTILYLAITTFRHSREVQRREMRMKLALSNAELRALEAQVNPHFLFNCLSSIRGMISEDPTQAQDMITRLANILRYNLQKDRNHTVPLASELEVVSDYLALESIRFESRLWVQLEIDHAVRQTAVPPMLLQTLVENAIKHGVEEFPSGAELFIRATLDGDGLRIEVENTGNLRAPRLGSTQIGLTNARERLRVLYGERASLQLQQRSAGRVTATILMPTIALPVMAGA